MNNPNNAHNELIEFVLDRAVDAPVSKRIRLYRALADIVGVPAEADHLRGLADQFEQAELFSCQFVFRFSQKLSAPSKPQP